VHPAPDPDPATVATPIAPNARPVRAMTPGKVGSAGVEILWVGPLSARFPIPSSIRQVVLRQYQIEHVAAHEYITLLARAYPDSRLFTLMLDGSAPVPAVSVSH